MSFLRYRVIPGAIGAVVLAVAGTALAGDVPITQAARTHFSAGVNFMQDPDGARYEEAYREFKAAYAESPSWKILGNLGICAMKLERDGEAIDAYEKYLKEGGSQLGAAERAQFTRDLSTLKASVVSLTLDSKPAGASYVDERVPVRGEPVVNRYASTAGKLALGIRPGHHRITAHLDGYQDAHWEFDAPPSGKVSHVFTLEKPTAGTPATPPTTPAGPPATGAPGTPLPTHATTRPIPTGVFIGLAATGAFAVGAGVTGVLALKKKSDFNAANNGSDPTAASDLRSSGKTMNLVTDVLLGGAVVAAGVTAVLYLNRPAVPAEHDTALYVSPSIGPRGGGLDISGRF